MLVHRAPGRPRRLITHAALPPSWLVPVVVLIQRGALVTDDIAKECSCSSRCSPLVIVHTSAKTHPEDFLHTYEKPLSNAIDRMKHTWIIKCVMTQIYNWAMHAIMQTLLTTGDKQSIRGFVLGESSLSGGIFGY